MPTSIQKVRQHRRSQPGDVIVQAAQEPVSSPEDVAKSVQSVKKGARKTVLLELEDAKGGHRFVSVPV